MISVLSVISKYGNQVEEGVEIQPAYKCNIPYSDYPAEPNELRFNFD